MRRVQRGMFRDEESTEGYVLKRDLRMVIFVWVC